MKPLDLASCEAFRRELRPAKLACPLVIRDFPAAAQLHAYDGGHDVEYVIVERAAGEHIAITIGYAPRVEGTTLIYDLTAETLQGKARPFACDLSQPTPRCYALLPTQIEEITIQFVPATRSHTLVVEFHDAQSERIQGALPFRLVLRNAAGEVVSEELACTGRDGRFTRAGISQGELPAGGEVIVRSLLTGREATARQP
ncbi:MAG: hypothetical protein SFU86_02705 [Pirellulaceae bacterium]|nr:hypothetical protein [Pirellulaceae bacterium]